MSLAHRDYGYAKQTFKCVGQKFLLYYDCEQQYAYVLSTFFILNSAEKFLWSLANGT